MRRILLCVVLAMSVAVIVGGIDLVAEGIVDEQTVEDADNIRGFDRATFAAHGLPHIRAHNSLVRGESVVIVRDGRTTFEGEINDIDITATPHEVICDGLWEQCKRRTDYRKSLLETRYELFREVPVDCINWLSGTAVYTTQADHWTVDTDGQLLIIEPKGTVLKSNQGRTYGLLLNDGLDGSAIDRLVMDVNTALSACWAVYRFAWYADGVWTETEEIDASDTVQEHFDLTPSTTCNALLVHIRAAGDYTSSTEGVAQTRNLMLYADRTSAPTIPAAIAEVATGTGLATSSSMEASGSALAAAMYDTETARTEVIESLRSQLAAVYDVAFWESSTVYGTVRPTSPPLPARHLALRSSDLASPDDWSVRVPAESRIDAVCGVYELEPTNAVDVPYPTSTTWPATWGRDYNTPYCIVFDAGGGVYWYSILPSDGYNPSIWTPALTATAGARYLARVMFVEEYTAGGGTFSLTVSWRNSSDGVVGTSTIYSAAAAAVAQRWVEVTAQAPAGTAYAYIMASYSGHSAGYARAYMRGYQFTPADPAGTLKRIYYPSEPSAADARVATYTLGRATDTEASNAITQAYLQNADVPNGQARLDGRTLQTIDGAPVDPQHIRSLSWWASKIDSIDAEERGPFIVTSVQRSGDGTVTLGFDGEAYSPPGFTHPNAKTRYIGAHRVRRRYMKRVSFATYWKWRNRNKKKLPPLPSKHPKYGRVPSYRWVEVEGRYV